MCKPYKEEDINDSVNKSFTSRHIYNLSMFLDLNTFT
jgi:hypothetical protein